jgi:hypothetical protein
MIIKVSIDIDIDTTDSDIEDLRDELLDAVISKAKENPDLFLLEPQEN